MLLAKDCRKTEYKAETGTHVLTFPLVTTRCDEEILYKRFGIAAHIDYVITKRANILLSKLKSDERYQSLLKQYGELRSSVSEEEFEVMKKPIADEMNNIRKTIGLTKCDLEKYAKVQAKLFKSNFSSQQVQKLVANVWSGVQKVLFSDGKILHYKKAKDVHSISCKSPKNGIKLLSEYHNYLNDKDVVIWPEGQIIWNGISIKVKIDYDDPYVIESLQYNVKYCEVKREMFESGYRYYLIVYLQGDAPKKFSSKGKTCGIDPGVSTVAVYSENKLILKELAPEARSYQKKILKLQKQVDECKFRMNPENYNEDGTIKKGKHTWKLSKTAKRKQRLITVLYRKERENRLCSHRTLVNEIARECSTAYIEPMNYKALQKRSKKTERQDKATEVAKKNGETIVVHKFKRKKRFGSSCRTRAPSLFIQELKKKVELIETDTKKLKPSQYDHTTGEYTKTDLKTRFKEIGGHIVQRDLYAAFINYCSDGEKHDDKKANTLFEDFVNMQNELISEMKQDGVSMPQCFGF